MARKPNRIESIDAVRGLAIIMMVFSHGLHWFHTARSHDVFSFGTLSIGDVATPMFFIIAGVALQFSLTARRQRTSSDDLDLWQQYGARFKQLFIFGIPISIVWGVLQAQAVILAGLVFLSLRVFRRGRDSITWWAFGISALAFVAHHVVAPHLAKPPFLNVLFGGHFPLFALAALVSFGFGWGSIMRRGGWILPTFVVGGLFAAVAWAHSVSGGAYGRIGMPVGYIVFGVAVTLLTLGVMHLPALRRAFAVRWLGVVGRYGLFMFMLHYALLVVQVVLFGWWHRMEVWTAVVASVLLVVMTVSIGLRYRVDARAMYGFMDRLLLQISPALSNHRTESLQSRS